MAIIVMAAKPSPIAETNAIDTKGLLLAVEFSWFS
jgi:hypothetical protein